MNVGSHLRAIGSLFIDGLALELPRTEPVEDMLKAWQLDDRWPFTMSEIAYRKGDRVWIPQGVHLAAKLDCLVHVVGPWRLRRGVPFTVPDGGGYDPIEDVRTRRVTHRRSNTSQHQGGSAWDIHPKGDTQPNEDDIGWLEGLDLPFNRKVSVGVYYPGRGNFIHVDVRAGRPWRSRLK